MHLAHDPAHGGFRRGDLSLRRLEIHFKEKVEKGIYDFGNALQGPVDAFWNNEIYRALRISSRQGQKCLIPECRCCANTVSPNDVRSHIMEWDIREPENLSKLRNRPRPSASETAAKIPPLVSVIVPTYNRPQQLAMALKKAFWVKLMGTWN